MSKRVWQHPEVPAEEQGTEVWRSVGELEEAPHFKEWMEREFPEGSGHLSEEDREVSRRNFVKLMGASSAMAGLGLASCRRPEAYIVPFKNAPEWVIPGKPLFYASAMPTAAGAVPLVVTSYEGRPTKLEPNHSHPDGSGADAFTQASVLDMYSPSRSKTYLHNNEEATKEDFEAAFAEVVKKPGKVGIVFAEDDCPTRHRLVKDLAKTFDFTPFSYEALTGEEQRRAYQKSFGSDGVSVVTDFEKADRILSLDCDFVGTDNVGSTKAFSARRQGGAADYKHEVDAKKMNRLYVVESAYSLTGGMADHRLRATPTEVLRYAAEIAREVGNLTGDGKLKSVASQVVAMAPKEEWKAKWVKECAKDLVKAKGKAMVLAGTRQTEAVQHLAIAINSALQAYGENAPLKVVQTGRQGYGTIQDLADFVNGGKVETLIFLTPSNPVYDAPADLGFAELVTKVKTSIHLGQRADATARACTWHVPSAHYLESWSDARTSSGTYTLVQPQIFPLFGTVSELEFLEQLISWSKTDWDAVEKGDAEAPVLLAGEGPEGAASFAHDAVRKTFAEFASDDDKVWREALQAGFVADTSYKTIAKAPNPNGQVVRKAAAPIVAGPAPSAGSLEVIFAADASVWDGRYIDNAWLQEAPDPVIKLTWDNAAQVSPKTAKDLGIYDKVIKLQPKTKILGDEVENGPKPEGGEGRDAKAPMIKVQVGEKTLVLPVVIGFGHADNCITIPVGYGQGATDGRSGAPALDEAKPVVGLVGQNTGFDVYPLRTTDTSLFATAAKISTTSDSYKIASTQEHHAMYGRALAREVSTLEAKGKSFEEQVKGVKKQGMDSHMPENISLYKPTGSIWEREEDKKEDLVSDKIHQWGMAIDLNTCTGCNACLVACQAENAIPVVGKEQLAMGREMHWIRMDRYFAAPKKVEEGYEWVQDNPEMIPQPVACVQCESAPCETVCPVNATVHTEEGLNAMAYNRCIGTRYCANNCPYKARRFNYFDYNKRNPLIKKNLYKGPFGKKQVAEGPHLQRNPNVTVRMRGVMEKCTYCVQRLEGAKIKQKQIQRLKSLDTGDSTKVAIKPEDLRVKTDSIKVACQDACEAGAITFGNLLDKDSTVVRAKGSHFLKDAPGSARNYDLLNYIGTRPRTSYLARVKNPNAAMPDAKYLGQATIHMH